MKMNFTNENIDWAKWSWNPITGCQYNCDYCYARDISNRFYPDLGFKPEFHRDRLVAPAETKIPRGKENLPGIRNVFVCSMADMFGEWIPNEWIEQILNVCKEQSQWNYIFLSKNPERLMTIGDSIKVGFPENSWKGVTIDTNDRLKKTTQVLETIDFTTTAQVKFVSFEPLLERLNIELVSNLICMVDWVIVGARSKTTTGPEFQPEWQWVEDILRMSRRYNKPVYFKPNLTVRPMEYLDRKI